MELVMDRSCLLDDAASIKIPTVWEFGDLPSGVPG